jgi:hypothetical protein
MDMRLAAPDKRSVPSPLDELRTRLAGMPVEGLPAGCRDELLALCQRVQKWSQDQGRLVQAAQDTFDQFRLDMTYLRFDLEATRRERDSLRKQVN